MKEITDQFDQMDENHDGFLTKEEILAVVKPTGEKLVGQEKIDFEAQFAALDANEDGKISREEQTAFFEKLFDEQLAPIISAMEEI